MASRVGSLSLSRSLSSVSSSSLIEPKTLAVKIARCYDGNAKIVEIPPGPPVLSPLVAEVYGIDCLGQIALAKQVRATFADSDDIVDIDDSVEYPSAKFLVVVDRAKPIALTALAAMAGAAFILDDPIFSGLAVSLLFGLFVSTVLTLVVIPLVYYGVMRKQVEWIRTATG